MKKVIIFFLLSISLHVNALVPIEGIIFGDVQDIKQFDPFTDMLTNSYFDTKKLNKEQDKLLYYTALYKQGENLNNKCESISGGEYSNFWKEDTAKRSVAATLQYIGLDLSLKAIVGYAKKLEYSDKKFTRLYTNLIQNTCSQNLTVYSLKMLDANFRYYWKRGINFELPSFKSSPFVNKKMKEFHDTYDVYYKEFNYSLKNFRAFCSWNGDSQNFGLMSEYLKNPFVMSFVNNNLLKKKINIDQKTEEIYLSKSETGIQVSCENLICRKRDEDDFIKYFPRMNGSSAIEEDLSFLYCTKFKNTKINAKILNENVKKWRNAQTVNERKLEVLNFLSLITGYPDISLIADNYNEIYDYLKLNIKGRWDKWAENKSNEFNLEQLYEESLEVTLRTQKNTSAIEKGRFNIQFDVELGEIDKLLDGTDKITSSFNLRFPVSYIKDLKEKIPFYFNNGRTYKLEELEKKLIQTISHQLELKKKYFKVPLWNQEMPTILAEELTSQIIAARGFRKTNINNKFISIPVQFNFGVFALQYIRKKYIFRYNNSKTLTFN